MGDFKHSELLIRNCKYNSHFVDPNLPVDTTAVDWLLWWPFGYAWLQVAWCVLQPPQARWPPWLAVSPPQGKPSRSLVAQWLWLVRSSPPSYRCLLTARLSLSTCPPHKEVGSTSAVVRFGLFALYYVCYNVRESNDCHVRCTNLPCDEVVIHCACMMAFDFFFFFEGN